MSDKRRITVTRSGVVDVEQFFTEFEGEWEDFLKRSKPSKSLREAFVQDTIRVMGEDVLDMADLVSDEIDVEKP